MEGFRSYLKSAAYFRASTELSRIMLYGGSSSEGLQKSTQLVSYNILGYFEDTSSWTCWRLLTIAFFLCPLAFGSMQQNFSNTINQKPLRLLHTLPHLCHLFTGPVWRTKRHAIPDFSKSVNHVS